MDSRMGVGGQHRTTDGGAEHRDDVFRITQQSTLGRKHIID